MSKTITLSARLPRERTNRMLEARVRKLEKQLEHINKLDAQLAELKVDVKRAHLIAHEVESRFDDLPDVDDLADTVDTIKDTLRRIGDDLSCL